MAAGEILEEEEVTLLEEEVTLEGEVTPEEGGAGEIQPRHTINFQGNNPQSSKEIDGDQKPLCKNGTYTKASIDILHK